MAGLLEDSLGGNSTTLVQRCSSNSPCCAQLCALAPCEVASHRCTSPLHLTAATSPLQVVACVSPSESEAEETLNTLQYAGRMRHILNRPLKVADVADPKPTPPWVALSFPCPSRLPALTAGAAAAISGRLRVL
eukprot:7381927-Prymnesium_polylepis.1